MTDSELIENNDEIDNRVQNDPAATDDTGSSGYSALISNVNQRTDAQSSDDNDIQGTASSSYNRSKKKLRYISKYLVQYVPYA